MTVPFKLHANASRARDLAGGLSGAARDSRSARVLWKPDLRGVENEVDADSARVIRNTLLRAKPEALELHELACTMPVFWWRNIFLADTHC
jgi:hypothetical protein